MSKYREFVIKYDRNKWFYVDDVLSYPPDITEEPEGFDCEVIELQAYDDLKKEFKMLQSGALRQLKAHEKLKEQVDKLVEGLEYITSREHMIGVDKWDAEFVEVAKITLADYEKFKEQE